MPGYIEFLYKNCGLEDFLNNTNFLSLVQFTPLFAKLSPSLILKVYDVVQCLCLPAPILIQLGYSGNDKEANE